MGQSSSTEQPSPEQREVESLAASTGALPVLRNAFSLLCDPQTKAIPLNSLRECFCVTFENSAREKSTMPTEFPVLLNHLGSCVVDQLFISGKEGVGWIEFLRGFTKICGRTATSTSLNNLFRLFASVITKANLPEKLSFESDDEDCKMSGFVLPSDVLMLLLLCWVMSSDSLKLRPSQGKSNYGIPDINQLVLSAVLSCTDSGGEFDVWMCDIMSLNVHLPAGKIHMWAMKTVPNIANCFSEFVSGRLRNLVACEGKLEPICSSSSDVSSVTQCNDNLLTCGRAWAISLSLTNTMRGEILKACFPSEIGGTNEVIYRSSLHGKGLNRFWSSVEGYNGPLIVLISATAANASEGNSHVRRWIVGALTHQGFENKDQFYGSSGCLYAISPVFHTFSSLGKEKNFVYSHLHPASRVYDPHPKPVGIAFGGSTGNERVFMDEGFATVTIRHHAVDKTYQPGSLFPNQGFLPFEASVVEVEVWGLGGRRAREVQNSFKKREELFSEQRRKVDLKTFGNWEDSPEKMMMDMVTDPNAVRREDR